MFKFIIQEGGYDITMFSQTLAAPAPDFAGDNLVAAPQRVAKVQINYARTAKRMDMKKLKNNLWDLLIAQDNKENDSK